MSSRSAAGFALVAPKRETLGAALDEALAELGLRQSGTGAKAGRLYLRRGTDHVLLVYEWGDAALQALPRALARTLGEAVRLLELEVQESGGEEEVDARWVDSVIEPTGQARVHDSSDEPVGRSGDLAETLGNALWGWVEAEVSLGEPVVSDQLDLERLPSELPARLQQLIREIRAAGAWSVTARDGKHTVRVELPDGGRRISILSDDDRRAVEAQDGLPAPTSA
ncbi:MAG: hypothetical protein JJ863_27245 [Deltaproteobacteria bacterium]|nr:hypothetical protein [Deltaproteobacteria bacterium]